MTGIKPAVVNCPDYFYVAIFEIIEKNRVVQEISVDIVDMDYVG